MMRESLRGDKWKRRRSVVKTDDDHHHLPYLHQELVLENILNRLPVRTLFRFSRVCKLWYYTIHHDPHFSLSHSLQSQKNPRPVFCFLNVPDPHPMTGLSNLLFCLSSDDKKLVDDGGDGVEPIFLHRVGSIAWKYERQLLGYCNGLACFYHMGVIVEIFNPSRAETLTIFRPPFEGHSICYGFGFDSLTKEYKVVLIFHAFENHEFKCLVFTLGTNSWRESTSPPPNLHQIILRTTPYSKLAIFCDGALFWKTRSDEPANDNMLLSFDLHDEMFQVIQLPAECVPKTTQQQQLVHILESKGSLCVARLEKILLGGDNHVDQNSSTSCCKVHLHFLKDKVKQVWIKETFNLPSSLSPPCFYGTTTTITRIVSFSDWVLLSWYDGKRLQVYNLHTKHLKVVKPSTREGHLVVGERNLSHENLRQIDYQLNSHIQNFLSLKTFLPEGARRLDPDDLRSILMQVYRKPGGLLCVSRKPRECYHFN